MHSLPMAYVWPSARSTPSNLHRRLLGGSQTSSPAAERGKGVRGERGEGARGRGGERQQLALVADGVRLAIRTQHAVELTQTVVGRLTDQLTCGGGAKG